MHDRIPHKIQLAYKQTGDNRTVHCYKCGSFHEVSSCASSSICPACGCHIDFKDIRINNRSSCLVDTRGDLLIEKNGYLFCAKAICKNAYLYGSLSGSLFCEQNLTFASSGLVAAKLTAHSIEIPPDSRIACPFPIHAHNISVHGFLRANLVIDGTINIFKKGIVEGSVTARGINVDPGGELIGQLEIAPGKPKKTDPSAEVATAPLRVTRRPRWDATKRVL